PQGIDVPLKLWLQLHYDHVLVVLRIDGGDLSGTIRIVERALDLFRRYPKRSGAVAIDNYVHLGIGDLEIARDILNLRNVAHSRFHALGGRIQEGDVGPLQSELVETLRGATADLNRGGHLHEDIHPGDAAHLRAKLVHNLVGAPTLAVGLESEEDASLISAAAAPAHRRHEAGDVGVARDDGRNLL